MTKRFPQEQDMFVITGITGKVGGIAAQTLLNRGQRVRAVVRDRAKAQHWIDQGCDIAELAALDDSDGLAEALAGADGVFLLNPPNYDPEPGFPDTHAVAKAFSRALDLAKPKRAVFLSSIGAQALEFNLLNNAGIIETALRSSDVPVTMLRPAWFMENAAGDLSSARHGAIGSYLQPLDRPLPMVSVRDIGRVVADLLMDTAGLGKTVELEGPARYSSYDLAAAFAKALARDVAVSAIPSSDWDAIFRAEGMSRPDARIKMLEGLSEGWLAFESPVAEHEIGTVDLDAVILGLVE